MGTGTTGRLGADPLPDSLPERYALVRDRIARAAARSGRHAKDILLVAVTKSADPDQIRGLIDLGHRDFGENRVQSLIQHAGIVEEYLNRLRVHPTSKKPGAPTADAVNVRWHMIGHLQRNKARKAAEFVRLVHSVDSLRLAEELQVIATRRDQVIDVLVQVNCSGETSKYGCPIPAAIPLAEQIDTMVNVRVRGLMTMAAETDDDLAVRQTFVRCRELFGELRSSGVSEGRIDLLSMGMSGDFEIAIEEGANIVRVGSAIFGHSPRPDDEEPREAPEPDDEG